MHGVAGGAGANGNGYRDDCSCRRRAHDPARALLPVRLAWLVPRLLPCVLPLLPMQRPPTPA